MRSVSVRVCGAAFAAVLLCGVVSGDEAPGPHHCPEELAAIPADYFYDYYYHYSDPDGAPMGQRVFSFSFCEAASTPVIAGCKAPGRVQTGHVQGHCDESFKIRHHWERKEVGKETHFHAELVELPTPGMPPLSGHTFQEIHLELVCDPTVAYITPIGKILYLDYWANHWGHLDWYIELRAPCGGALQLPDPAPEASCPKELQSFKPQYFTQTLDFNGARTPSKGWWLSPCYKFQPRHTPVCIDHHEAYMFGYVTRHAGDKVDECSERLFEGVSSPRTWTVVNVTDDRGRVREGYQTEVQGLTGNEAVAGMDHKTMHNGQKTIMSLTLLCSDGDDFGLVVPVGDMTRRILPAGVLFLESVLVVPCEGDPSDIVTDEEEAGAA